jgi:hypothetical protein
MTFFSYIQKVNHLPNPDQGYGGEDASIPAKGYDDFNVHPFPLGDPMT